MSRRAVLMTILISLLLIISTNAISVEVVKERGTLEKNPFPDSNNSPSKPLGNDPPDKDDFDENIAYLKSTRWRRAFFFVYAGGNYWLDAFYRYPYSYPPGLTRRKVYLAKECEGGWYVKFKGKTLKIPPISFVDPKTGDVYEELIRCTPQTYTWYFGDGKVYSAAVVPGEDEFTFYCPANHTYTKKGIYVAILKVKSQEGWVEADWVPVIVGVSDERYEKICNSLFYQFSTSKLYWMSGWWMNSYEVKYDGRIIGLHGGLKVELEDPPFYSYMKNLMLPPLITTKEDIQPEKTPRISAPCSPGLHFETPLTSSVYSIGAIVDFKITFKNTYNYPIEGLVINDFLPSTLTFIGASPYPSKIYTPSSWPTPEYHGIGIPLVMEVCKQIKLFKENSWDCAFYPVNILSWKYDKKIQPGETVTIRVRAMVVSPPPHKCFTIKQPPPPGARASQNMENYRNYTWYENPTVYNVVSAVWENGPMHNARLGARCPFAVIHMDWRPWIDISTNAIPQKVRPSKNFTLNILMKEDPSIPHSTLGDLKGYVEIHLRYDPDVLDYVNNSAKVKHIRFAVVDDKKTIYDNETSRMEEIESIEWEKRDGYISIKFPLQLFSAKPSVYEKIPVNSENASHEYVLQGPFYADHLFDEILSFTFHTKKVGTYYIKGSIAIHAYGATKSLEFLQVVEPAFCGDPPTPGNQPSGNQSNDGNESGNNGGNDVPPENDGNNDTGNPPEIPQGNGENTSDGGTGANNSINYYKLTVNIHPEGAGDVKVFPEREDYYYEEGEEVVLYAIPNEGYMFDHWDGDIEGATIYGDTLVLTMDSNKTIDAYFIGVLQGTQPANPSQNPQDEKDDDNDSPPVYDDTIKPQILVVKPVKNAIRLLKGRLLPFRRTVIIGPMEIEVEANDNVGIKAVELFINGEKVAQLTDKPYRYVYDETGLSKCEVKVVAKDYAGNIATEEFNAIVINPRIFYLFT